MPFDFAAANHALLADVEGITERISPGSDTIDGM